MPLGPQESWEGDGQRPADQWSSMSTFDTSPSTGNQAERIAAVTASFSRAVAELRDEHRAQPDGRLDGVRRAMRRQRGGSTGRA